MRTIIDMVRGTRLDCVAGSAGGMRAALTEALWHTQHRTAFQKRLIDQPAMRGVLADLCLEAEAATALMLRLARAFDVAGGDADEAAFLRLATPIAKYHVCKRQPGFVYEALEAHGGAGYVEEGPMPRLFRQSPLNAIWEGSGNVIALDVLRALSREPAAFEAVRATLGAAKGRDRRFDDRLGDWTSWSRAGAVDETTARRFVEETALLQQASVLADGSDLIFHAFCRARLAADGHGFGYGTAEIKPTDIGPILDRAMPQPVAV